MDIAELTPIQSIINPNPTIIEPQQVIEEVEIENKPLTKVEYLTARADRATKLLVKIAENIEAHQPGSILKQVPWPKMLKLVRKYQKDLRMEEWRNRHVDK